MLYLSQIPFSIINNILLLGVLWIGFKLIELAFKPKASTLFFFATIAQFSSCILFILSIFNYHILPFHFVNVIPELNINTSESLFIYTVYFYFVGLFIYLVRFIFHFNKVHKLKIVGDFTTHSKWMNLLSTINIKLPKRIKIGLSDKVKTPIVFGFWEPIILLPISICNNLSNEEIKLVLIHELAHILRNDFLINLIIKLSGIVLWFNPFNYFFTRKINLLREIACDDFVIKNTNEPILYSKALYLVANSNSYNMSSYVIGVTNGNRNELLSRIKKLNNINEKSKIGFYNTFFAVLLVMIGFIGSIFLSKGKSIVNNLQVKQYAIKSNGQFAQFTALTSKQDTKQDIIKPKKQKVTISKNNNVANIVAIAENAENNSNYDALINETKLWIKQHQNPILYAGYSNIQVSVDNLIAEKFLMSSIIKSYQLKRAVMEQRLSSAKDMTEVVYYYMHSKEWDAIAEYEKWAKEYLGRHQQDTSLFPATTKQQIQYR